MTFNGGRRNRGLVALLLFVAGMVWPVGATALTWWALRRARIDVVGVHLAIGATIFALLAALAMGGDPMRHQAPAERLVRVSMFLASAAGVFLLSSQIGGIPLHACASSFAAGTFVAALSEEVVFRSILPRWLRSNLRATVVSGRIAWFGASVASQISFAAAHYVARDAHLTPQTATEFARLVAIGLSLQATAKLFGLSAAVGGHAALNLSLSQPGPAG